MTKLTIMPWQFSLRLSTLFFGVPVPAKEKRNSPICNALRIHELKARVLQIYLWPMTNAKANQINKFNKKTIIQTHYRYNQRLILPKYTSIQGNLLATELWRKVCACCMHKPIPSTQKRFSRYICVPTCIHVFANYSDSSASQRKFLPTACLVPRLLSEISFCVERPWRKSNIVIKPHMQPDCSLSYRTGCLCDFFAMVNG